jgi:hypothetical protein
LTDEQLRAVDEVVLAYVRGGGARASGIVDAPSVRVVLKTLPSAKADYRYVGDSLQRLKMARLIKVERQRWRTTSPTS